MGTLPQCLQKGVAIGKLQKARNVPNVPNNVDYSHNFILKVTLILFIDIILALCIIYFKPKFLLKVNTQSFDILKVILTILSITILLIILFFIILKI